MKHHPITDFVQAPDLSLRGFTAWLETKDPKDTYDSKSWRNCALAQWLKSIDPESIPAREHPGVNGYCYVVFGEIHNFKHLDKVVDGRRRYYEPFGEALERAKAQQGV